MRIHAKAPKLALLLVAWPLAVQAQSPATSNGNVAPGGSNLSPASERFFDIPLAGGAHQRVLLVQPQQAKATILMLPGGSGDIGLKPDGGIRHGSNFVVRTRALWAAQGYAVLLPDTIDRANLRGLRSSPHYARVVKDLVSFAHAQIAGPVFLLGTSQGAIAAMNGAAHATTGSLAGVVLTEAVSVMGGSHETIFDADPQLVRVPALVVANRDDSCDVAPPAMAAKIAAAMTASPDVEVATVSGGIDRSVGPCGSLTPHGYFGIERQVIDRISTWMKGHL